MLTLGAGEIVLLLLLLAIPLLTAIAIGVGGEMPSTGDWPGRG